MTEQVSPKGWRAGLGAHLMAHVIWIVPLLVTVGLVVSVAILDVMRLADDRSVVLLQVQAAALTAAVRPEEADRLARQALADVGHSDPSSIQVDTGRIVAGAFARASDQPVVRVALTASIPLTMSQWIGIPAPTYEITAIAVRTGATSLEFGPAVTPPRQFGSAVLDALSGVKLDLSPTDWQGLVKTSMPLERLLAALEAAADHEEGEDPLSIELPLALAVQAMVTGAITDDPRVRKTLERLASTTASSKIVVRLDRTLHLDREADTVPVLSAATTLVQIITAAVSTIPVIARLEQPADGVLALEVAVSMPDVVPPGIEVKAPVEAGRLAMTRSPASLVTRPLEIAIRATVPAGSILEVPEASIPLRIQVAPAEIAIEDVKCEGPDALRLAVVPPAATISYYPFPASEPALGEVTALMLEGVGLKAWIEGSTVLKPDRPTIVDFTTSEVGQGAARSVRSAISLAPLLERLFANPLILIEVAEEKDLDPANARSEATELVHGAAGALTMAIEDVLTTLGATPGQLDIRIHAAGCGAVRLIP